MKSEDTDTSRRLVVGGLATGLIAGANSSASAQASAAATGAGSETAPPTNPVTKYPKPPFQRQQQEWPGLAGKMNPRPDHGRDKLQRLRPLGRT